MIRDNIFPAARWRVPPEDDEIAAQRVSELCGMSLAGLTFTVYSSVSQLQRALENGAGFRVFEEKCVASGGAWTKIWKLKVINKTKVSYTLWLWQTQLEVTVLVVTISGSDGLDEVALKKFKEIIGD